ncbi:Protein kinase-like domain protein [Niveomyces insectorum RCEF 264]|uniref:non-specific serine/threonine protein kinase n=1 Tax=Niveomyces insectorum RCEF 264 TaxID=1081102 RepID=A0A167U3G8_9HYPO|nr:Protein kinase-like domain protein [Niveomyces insectorum RCEF 264]
MREQLSKEIKMMKKLSHPNIIRYLGNDGLKTSLCPEIAMPLREGSLRDLVNKGVPNHIQLCVVILEQMLCALDYLANHNVIHRDVKPDNILYETLPHSNGGYRFQLADFGIAHLLSEPSVALGTCYYAAPEIFPKISGVDAAPSPKTDVWSLLATMLAVYTKFVDFPPLQSDYRAVLKKLKDLLAQNRGLAPMGRLCPNRRVSAAQMLRDRFEGRGLTTPRNKIEPTPPEDVIP